MRKQTPIGAFNCTGATVPFPAAARPARSAGRRVDSAPMAPALEDRSLAVRLGVATALLLALVGQAQVTVLDGSSMLAVAHSIVHHGSLAVPPELGVRGDS